MFNKHFNYSTAVKSTKYFFVILSFGLITLALYNNNSLKVNLVSTDTKITDEFYDSNQILIGPSFLGLDKKKQPFKISASKAFKINSDKEVFNLENPKGELIKDGEFFFLEGNNGIFNKPQQILELKGKVIFSDKKMFSFNTSEATMDFNKKVIVGEKKVKGKKINSTIFAEGFKIEQKTNKIIFKGKSKLVLSKKTN